MSDVVDISGFGELTKILENLENPKIVDDSIREVGERLDQEFRKIAPKKTGWFVNNAKKVYIKKEGYLSFILKGDKKHWKGVFRWLETGTDYRTRKFLSKKRPSPKNPGNYAAGRMQGSFIWSNLIGRYEKILLETISKKFKERGK